MMLYKETPMLDVFTDEAELLIKEGIANLFWYRADMGKCLMRAGVEQALVKRLLSSKGANDQPISKRQIMDAVYQQLRTIDFNRRLEISRKLVAVLINQTSFVPQDKNHRVDIAERSALKLRAMIAEQQKERERRDVERAKLQQSKQDTAADTYLALQKVQQRFAEASRLPPQQRGYELEKIIPELMRIYKIPVVESFRIEGEQIDGAIKIDGRYYLVEIKWVSKPVGTDDIGFFYYKVGGKPDKRGIFFAMNGYEDSVTSSTAHGRDLMILLFDGRHLTNAISGVYTMPDLLEYAIQQFSLKGVMYCSHSLD